MDIKYDFDDKFNKYFNVDNEIKIKLKIEKSSNYQFGCFALEDGLIDKDLVLLVKGKYAHSETTDIEDFIFKKRTLTDEKYFINQNNIYSPDRAVKYDKIKEEEAKGITLLKNDKFKSEVTFIVNLSILSPKIKELVFVGGTEGNNAISEDALHTISIEQNGKETISKQEITSQFKFEGEEDDKKEVKSVKYMSLIKKGAWYIEISPSLIKSKSNFNDFKWFYQEKQAASSIRKALKNNNINKLPLEISLVLPTNTDVLKAKYIDGTMHQIFNTIFPLGLYFSPNKTTNLIYYAHECDAYELDETILQEEHNLLFYSIVPFDETTYELHFNGEKINKLGTSMNVINAMEEVISYSKLNYKNNIKTNSFIIFVINNEGDQSYFNKDEEIKKLLNESTKYRIFWQFIGIGNSNKSNYGVFNRLDEISDKSNRNFDFWAIDDFVKIPIEDWYNKLIKAIANCDFEGMPTSLMKNAVSDMKNSVSDLFKTISNTNESHSDDNTTENTIKNISETISKVTSNKDKKTAGLLSIFLGTFGAHKFYLNNKKMGKIYLLFSFTSIPTFLGIYEGIKFLMMSDEEFKNKYDGE